MNTESDSVLDNMFEGIFSIAMLAIAIGVIYGVVQFISSKISVIQAGNNYLWLSVGIFMVFLIYNIVILKNRFYDLYSIKNSKRDWYLLRIITYMPFVIGILFLFLKIAGLISGHWVAGSNGFIEVTIQFIISTLTGLILGAQTSTILYLSTYFGTATTGLAIAVIVHNFFNNGGYDIFVFYDFLVDIYLGFVPDYLTSWVSAVLAVISILTPFLIFRKIEEV